PDVLLCRSEAPLTSDLREKIALFCNVPTESVIDATDVESIYDVPLVFHRGGLDAVVARELSLDGTDPDLGAWNDFLDRVHHPSRECLIGVVGKYTHVRDAYKSIIESFVHAGAAHRARVRLRWVEGEDVEQRGAAELLREVDGLVVPGGFGERGIEGKIAARAYARTEVEERHRHRYEFNNRYAAALQSRGLVLSGKCVGRELVEIIELPDHPWYLAVQFHPELKSRPHEPHPLFVDFV